MSSVLQLARCAFIPLLLAKLAGAAPALDYNRDIRPILAENCFACHGPDEKARKGKLRLDLAERAYAERNGLTPIKPGDPANSEAWLRLTSKEEDEMMPPPEAHARPTAAQRERIKAWIEQGAKYADHWSFIPPHKAELPAGGNGHPIDAFIRARLAPEKLRPSPEADRATLIRRVSLDLSGLPPSADEVEAFVRDRDPRAYEKLVDRLLQSDHYGERMALDWLDAARYADTNGFSIDGGRNLWLWRDWVIQAFNDNMPYDRFLMDQLAGDLLPDGQMPEVRGQRTDGGGRTAEDRGQTSEVSEQKPQELRTAAAIQNSPETQNSKPKTQNPTRNAKPETRNLAQLIATGFQRNNMVTHEGGTIPEENLTNYNVDRVKTLGESVLGLTVGCAQCHDHKFDPISQREYYQVYAFFNTLSDKGLDGNAGVNPGPSIQAQTVLRSAEVPQLREQIAALKAELARPDPKVLERWEIEQSALLAARGRDFQLHPVKVIKVSTPNRGAGFEAEDGNRVRLRDAGALGAFDISTELPNVDQPITGIRVVMHPLPELGGGWGSGPAMPRRPRATAAPKPTTQADTDSGSEDEKPPKGTFMLTAIAATADAVPGDQVNLHKLQRFARVTANSWQSANPPAGCLDPRNETGWAPDLATTGPVHLTATFAQPVRADATPFLTVQLNFGNGKNLIASLIEVLVTTGTDDGTDLPREIVAALETAPAQRTPPVADRLWNHCRDHAPALEPKRVALANLEERLAVLTQKFSTMVMDVAAKPRDTFILHRGDYMQPTEKVSAGTLAALPPLPEGAPANRLGLARWLTMKEHPLTARVAVNRIWKMLFGTGIVATLADFGAQGEWPTHPELLDWLAVDFMENGWEVKRLIRAIVLSGTYRQDSAASPELLERDPQNRLLARGPRFRLPAEFVRDSALKISGLLVPRVGGPSVNPYTPGDLWREVSHYGSTPATAQTFVQDHGEKLYRRSLYTYWKRTAPPPNMTAFDAPNREVCTVDRPNTTTPLQALVTLNDPQFVEASRAFAERILSRAGDDRARLRWAFREATSRELKPAESALLEAAVARERKRYTANPRAAEKYLAIGESPRNAQLPAPEHAAWAQVAALLLNLSETITRN